MTTTSSPPTAPRSTDDRTATIAAIEGIRFDAVMAALGVCITAGVVADGWSHIQFGADQSVFNPYHLTFYSGAICTLIVLATIAAARLRLGVPWPLAVPAGYRGALYGAAAFLTSGVVDLAGHAAFGFETGIEIIVSPTHLALFACWVSVASGPVFAARCRHGLGELIPPFAMIPAAASAACVAVALSTSLSPFVALSGLPIATKSNGTEIMAVGDALGLARVILQTTVVVGVLVWARSQFRLPTGFNFIYLAMFGALIAGLREQWWMLWFGAVVGMIWELLPPIARKFVDEPSVETFVAIAAPATLWPGAFLKFAFLDDDFTWDLYLWSGSIAQSAAVGALLAVIARSNSTRSTHRAHTASPLRAAS